MLYNNDKLENIYKEFAVSTSNFYATKIGYDILNSGGNIFDAAVAVGFALGVSEPYASGLGGGGLAIIRTSDKLEKFIDFREISSIYFNSDDYLKCNENDRSSFFCIPKEVHGLLHILKNYGSKSREFVLEPCIKLADEGFLIDEFFYNVIMDNKKKLMVCEELSSIYLDNFGEPKKIGERIINKNLSKTLSIISKYGESSFTQGNIIEAILKKSSEQFSIKTNIDFENIKVNETSPFTFYYKNYKILAPSLPSGGGALLYLMLKVIEKFDLTKISENTTLFYHLFSEIFKRCYKYKNLYLGDGFHDEFNYMASKKSIDEIYNSIDIHSSIIYNNIPKNNYCDNTTHYSISDNKGNSISVTKTINGYFGNFCGVNGYGFVLNNTIKDFSDIEESNNFCGKSKRPLSNMTPIIVLKDNKPFLTLGSPGGNKITATVFQILIRILEYNNNLKDAVDNARVWDDENCKLVLETIISQDVFKSLVKIGHNCEYKSDYFSSGAVQVIKNTDTQISAYSDFRKNGFCMGI